MERDESAPTGAQLRDAGMQRAVKHADRVNKGWSEHASKLAGDLLLHLGTGALLTTEVIREYADFHGLEQPPDNRSWGAVMRKLANQGFVRKAGYSLANDPKVHCRPVTLWEVL